MGRSETIELMATEAGSSPALGVVVVNYNARELLGDCVGAVLASGVAVEVIVSDNGSTDDSLAQLQKHHGGDARLQILKNGSNLGFARGNNIALPHIRAPYLLVLNPDCIVAPGTLSGLLAFMAANPAVGMAGCVIRNPDGTEQVASRRVIPDPWIGLIRVLHLDRLWPRLLADKRLNRADDPLPQAPVPVEAISGSFMLVRRQALDDVGPLDEGYFLHCEDLDWFVRFRQAGWPIYLVPDLEVVHHKGACSTGRPVAVEWHKHKGMARFFRKFQYHDYPLAFSLLVVIGIWAHFAAFLVVSGLGRLSRGGSRR